MTTQAAAPPRTRARSLNFVIGALGVGAIASILDSTIVNVAVDHLSTVFNTPVTHTQWVVTSFLLAMAAIVPLSGWLIDRLGGRTAWMIALSTFLVGSILCGLAWNIDALIAFRALQGLGAGLIVPILMAVLTQVAGPDRLMSAMGSFSLLVQVGPILGPVVGGALVQAADWRWVFFVNVPFCLLGLTLAPFALPAHHATVTRRRLDLVGLALMAPALVGLVLGVSNVSPTHGFGQLDVWLPLALGIVLLALFTAWSLRDGQRALIDVRLFTDRTFRIANLLSIALGFTMFGGMLLLPLYFQGVLGASTLEAGLLLVPQGIGAAAIILGAKKYLRGISPRTRILAGFILMALGTVPFALPDLRDQTVLTLLALVVRGTGVGLATPALSAMAIATLPSSQVARGTTAFNIVQRVGAPFGTTVLAVVLARATEQSAATVAGIAGAFSVAFWWAIAATAIPVILALLLPRATPKATTSPQASGAAR
ncbi:MAG: multidrug efflux MFS transporter [Propionibacteriales bacterium]|nr:multidrug efflux MFS transporter [Propionibacteriales bacterium]